MNDPIDIFVGERVRAHRALCGYTQSDLAEKLDVTPQQIQKYEIGHNRISASKLFKISVILGVDIDTMFSDSPPKKRGRPIHKNYSQKFTAQASRRETLELVRVYGALDNQDRRLLKSILARLVLKVSEV